MDAPLDDSFLDGLEDQLELELETDDLPELPSTLPPASTGSRKDGGGQTSGRFPLPVQTKKIFKRPSKKRSAAAFKPAGNGASASAVPRMAEGVNPAQTANHAIHAGTCPPHPGFYRGLCIRCGQLQRESAAFVPGQDSALSLRYGVPQIPAFRASKRAAPLVPSRLGAKSIARALGSPRYPFPSPTLATATCTRS